MQGVLSGIIRANRGYPWLSGAPPAVTYHHHQTRPRMISIIVAALGQPSPCIFLYKERVANIIQLVGGIQHPVKASGHIPPPTHPHPTHGASFSGVRGIVVVVVVTIITDRP